MLNKLHKDGYLTDFEIDYIKNSKYKCIYLSNQNATYIFENVDIYYFDENNCKHKVVININPE